MLSRTLGLSAAGAAAILGLVGLAAAKADNLLNFGPSQPPEPAIYRSTNTPIQDRLLAKAAFTEVLARKNQTLGMIPPANLAPYAPVYPDGFVIDESLSGTSPTGGALEYDAPGSLRTVLDFYEDAAALHHMPFKVSAEGPQTLVLAASDGRREMQARLTHQFANSTVVDLTYR